MENIFSGPCCAVTFQEPPLSGPTLSITLSAFSFARCFSIAFAVTPISAVRPAAVNLPFSERRAMIFSLLSTLQNLHKAHLHILVDCTTAVECTAAFEVAGKGSNEVRIVDQLVDVAYEGRRAHFTADSDFTVFLIPFSLHSRCQFHCSC